MPRTDPSGSFEARIMFMGVYPAATEVRRMMVGGVPMMLPTAVELESFAPTSKSGKEIDDNYLSPLGLTRVDVLITDMMPYFLGNTTKSGSGRSMADNLRLYEQHTGKQTGIEPRPSASELVAIARSLPGNLDRLREYAKRCSPSLLFTLGAETAAFVRAEEHAKVAARVDELFYAEPARLSVLGVDMDVVHLVHPHLFIKKNARWIERHRVWCSQRGRRLAEERVK